MKDTRDDVLRPRTAYNFFYRYQRDLILKARAPNSTVLENETNPHLEADLFLNSARSRGKRPHRKTHGLIGLQQLTKTVAKRWKEVNPETRNKFLELAAQDKIRYKNETQARSRAVTQSFHMVNNQARAYHVGSYSSMPDYSPSSVTSNHDFVAERVPSSNFSSSYRYDRYPNENHLPLVQTSTEKRSHFVPVSPTSNQSVPLYNALSGTILSAEEYDMLNLLIQE